MSLLVTVAYLISAGVMFWHSADSPDRRPLHRAMLYAFAFALMCWGSARMLMLFGVDAADWQWMVDLGHVAMIAFAVMWMHLEIHVLRLLRKKGS